MSVATSFTNSRDLVLKALKFDQLCENEKQLVCEDWELVRDEEESDKNIAFLAAEKLRADEMVKSALILWDKFDDSCESINIFEKDCKMEVFFEFQDSTFKEILSSIKMHSNFPKNDDANRWIEQCDLKNRDDISFRCRMSNYEYSFEDETINLHLFYFGRSTRTPWYYISRSLMGYPTLQYYAYYVELKVIV
jgi:hypothetical protein